MPFTNPLVAGTTLIRSAINSPNYVAGVSGWSINKDGSAEFNNVAVRGTFFVIGVNNSGIGITTQGGLPRIQFTPQDVATYTFTPGLISESRTTPTAPGGYQQLDIQSPSDSGFPASHVVLQGSNSFDPHSSIMLDATNVNVVNTHDGTQTGANLNVTRDVTITRDESVGRDLTVTRNGTFNGVLTAANRLVGTATLTNTTANVPYSQTITFPAPLTGTLFNCQVTANSTVPGTGMLGVSYTALSATGVTLWITRTNVQATTLSYTVEGF